MDVLDKEQDKEQEILNLLKKKKVYPGSGFGSVTVNLQNHKITYIERKEHIRI